MKKIITIFSVIVFVLGLLAIRDYHNYFKGRSIINYHKLPYELTPDYYKHYDTDNGKRIALEEFNLITGCSEFVGSGCPIPMNSPSTFTIDTIKCYYYSDDSIFVFCVDEKNKPHWIIPVKERDSCVVFVEIKNVKIENLTKYKYVSNFYDGK